MTRRLGSRTDGQDWESRRLGVLSRPGGHGLHVEFWRGAIRFGSRSRRVAGRRFRGLRVGLIARLAGPLRSHRCHGGRLMGRIGSGRSRKRVRIQADISTVRLNQQTQPANHNDHTENGPEVLERLGIEAPFFGLDGFIDRLPFGRKRLVTLGFRRSCLRRLGITLGLARFGGTASRFGLELFFGRP